MRRMAWCKPRKTGDDHQLEDGIMNIPPPNDTSPDLSIQFSKLAQPAETTFFQPLTDDHDLPLPELMFNTLLTLPVDLRALCMSRIVLTGPHSNIPGLKTRLLSELSQIIEKRGWDVVESYGSASKPISERPHDDLADRLSQQVLHSTTKDREKVVKGVVRGVETLGAWSGASLMASLRVKGKGELEREEFLRDPGQALSPVGSL